MIGINRSMNWFNVFKRDDAMKFLVYFALRARCQVTRILIHVRDTERVMPRQMLTGRSQLPTQDRHRKALVLCENLVSYVYDWVQFGTVHELRRVEGGNCSSTSSTQVRNDRGKTSCYLNLYSRLYSSKFASPETPGFL